MTFGPGDDPWEKFGHNAVEIVDPTAPSAEDRDRTYNWGTFNFDNGFYWKFAEGRLMYQMRSDPTAPTLNYYADVLNRNIIRQELNLSLKQKIDLRLCFAKPTLRKIAITFTITSGTIARRKFEMWLTI